MIFDPGTNPDALWRQMNHPAGRRLRRSSRTQPPAMIAKDGSCIELPTLIAHQLDDRPAQPTFGAEFADVRQVNYTARRSAKPSGWVGVVAGIDDGVRRSPMVRSSEIRPPVIRDFTGTEGNDRGRGAEMKHRIEVLDRETIHSPRSI